MRPRRDSKLASRGSWSNSGAFVWAVRGGAWRAGLVRKVEIEVKAREMVKSVGRFSVVLVVAGLVVVVALAGSAGAAGCSNEAFRTGRSASLPDCRAYELVTPEDLGRTQDMTFENGANSVLAGARGDALALRALGVFFEPGANVSGARDVFSRAAHGWVMKPIATPAMLGEEVLLEQFSPDLSQVAFSNTKSLSGTGGIFERGPRTFRLGPVGGPYSTIATVPEAYSIATRLQGANNGAPGVPGLSDLVLESADHLLLPAGPEREAAEQTEPGLPVLYEWSGGQLHLLNVDSEGKLLNPCGAVLGYKPGFLRNAGNALNSVSANGSKVFFTSPQEPRPGCPEPALYMRVDGGQTVDVSEPEGVSVSPSGEVIYVGASVDGSKVFFATATALTPAAQATVGPYLYEYDTEAAVEHRLKLIGNQVPVQGATVGTLNPFYLTSEDGSQVYYRGVCSAEAGGQRVTASGICRYEAAAGETQVGKSTLAAVPRAANGEEQPSFVTADGRFLLFQSEGIPQPVEFVGPHGLEQELRGSGRDQQLYRYDAADGSVICVSCGEGTGPVAGFQELPQDTVFKFVDLSASVLAMSEDGSRVFFQTTASLVPRDRNGSRAEEEKKEELGPGTDVYEWEQAGTEEAPGVFCRGKYGCTHLISAGEDVGPERFLGASADGRDVFFESAAQLLPQATPEFSNIYDARMGGGFPPSRAVGAECSSCQGVGSPPPQFGQGASETFAGAGNPALAAGSVSSPAHVKSKGKPRSGCGRGFVRGRRGRCVRVVRRRGVRR